MGALLGTLAALTIGLSDLFGRRIVLASTPLTAALALQLAGATVALTTVAVVPSQWLWSDVGRGLLSGLGMAVGLSGYYTGLLRSTSTIVAPLVATVSAVLPFGYVQATTDEGTAPGLAFAGVAFLGLTLVSAGAGEVSNVGAGVRWGLLSGGGYGVALAALTDVSSASGTWPAASQRLAAFAVLALLASIRNLPVLPPRGTRASGALAGALVAGTTILVLIGVQFDAGATVVTVSMFPAFSVAIGRMFFGDPVRSSQVVGIVVVLVGVAGVMAA